MQKFLHNNISDHFLTQRTACDVLYAKFVASIFLTACQTVNITWNYAKNLFLSFQFMEGTCFCPFTSCEWFWNKYFYIKTWQDIMLKYTDIIKLLLKHGVLQISLHSWWNKTSNIGCFIMFSLITNIYIRRKPKDLP